MHKAYLLLFLIHKLYEKAGLSDAIWTKIIMLLPVYSTVNMVCLNRIVILKLIDYIWAKQLTAQLYRAADSCRSGSLPSRPDLDRVCCLDSVGLPDSAGAPGTRPIWGRLTEQIDNTIQKFQHALKQWRLIGGQNCEHTFYFCTQT